MGLTREDKQEYRRKRNGLGWLAAAGWIVYWWAQPSDGSWSGEANHGFMMIVAVITAPFAFLLSHYVARMQVDRTVRRREEEGAATAEVEHQREEAARAERARKAEAEADRVRGLLDRAELIRKLGTVRDYLALLPDITDNDRAVLIRQSIDKELRDLVAKHEPAALAAMLAHDQPARLSLGAVLQTLEQRGGLSADAASLRMALVGQSAPSAFAAI